MEKNIKECEQCVGNGAAGAEVYYTKYGNRYHNSLSCKGLKRKVKLVALEQTDWTAAVLEMREKGGVRKPDMSRAGVFFPGETGKKDGKQKLGFAERRPRLCIRKK